jgi:hypothetical protein
MTARAWAQLVSATAAPAAAGGSVSGILISGLGGHLSQPAVIGVLALSALITVTGAVVRIVNIRTNRSGKTRMASSLAKMAKSRPEVAARLYVLIDVTDKALPLKNAQLEQVLADNLKWSTEEKAAHSQADSAESSDERDLGPASTQPALGRGGRADRPTAADTRDRGRPFSKGDAAAS